MQYNFSTDDKAIVMGSDTPFGAPRMLAPAKKHKKNTRTETT
ncbi:hypothetical protein RR42_s1271 [Cupriavidus basilensis]|uniref:Uncharacterized protein n=1 Tax=Cupriavidus basilensis TaxID=68895 RepID=A0A0C4YLG2_9BURK|nr:hypothetical protein RR42_s1271 [Cupriavidus basilensis]